LEQQLGFTTASDGVSICYATVGEGPPLVKAPNWLSHLEYDWRSPVWRHWWEELARDHRLIRFDQRGIGLSDWDVEDMSFEARVSDLEAVVDALGLEKFALLGISQGGPAAAEYSIRHPERVTHLIIYGGFAIGQAHRTETPEQTDEREALNTLMRLGWGRENPSYRQIFTTRFMPEATAEDMDSFNELQRVSASPENAVRTHFETSKIDLRDRLPLVSVPTLVLHSREEIQVPFENGRQMATLIPGARIVPLASKNHILQESEPAWPVFLSEVRRFLGVGESDAQPAVAPAPSQPASVSTSPGTSGDEEEAHSLISGMDEVSLGRYSVVPGYAKFDEVTRNVLKDARQKIAEGLGQPTSKRENHLFWAAPGSGKTYFAVQTVASLPGNVRYHELNLAKLTEAELLAGLREMDGFSDPCLCLIDEVDAKPEEVWPYEVLLPYLDASVERNARFVFVMAGSSGSSIGEMKQRIASRPKGTDMLSRIPGGNEYEIPSMGVGDRVLVVLSQFLQAGREAGKEIQSVEKLGLYFVAVTPRLANARQLREFAVRAVDRMPPGEDRIKYDHLFGAGDPENKTFWAQSSAVAGDLVNRYLAVRD
jgi:pimeloyl-ACP methyl ester carboxylesterase